MFYKNTLTSCSIGKPATAKIPEIFLADFLMLQLICVFWGFKFYTKYSFIEFTNVCNYLCGSIQPWWLGSLERWDINLII